MMLRQKFALIALASLTAAACGLKGPLHRPDESKDEVAAPTSESASTPKKKERSSGNPPGDRIEPPVSPPDPDRPKPPPDR